MSAAVRLGLVGCGRLAERGYVPAARAARGVRLTAVADPDEGRRTRLAAGLPAYGSAAELVAAGGIDAVVLATPVEAHLADARLCVEAGVTVLVEKPPAADAAGAAELALLEPTLFVGFQRRFDPELVRLRELGAREERLELELVLDIERRSWSPYVVRDEALLDLAPHLVDLAAWISGSEVEAVGAARIDRSSVTLQLELGRGTAFVTCAHDRPYRELVAVRSGGRELGRSQRGGRLRRIRERLGGAGSFVSCLAAELEALAAATRGESRPELATALDGLRVMTVLDEARFVATPAGVEGGP